MKDGWSVYRVLLLASLRARMAYKTDFLLSALLSALVIGSDLLGTLFIVHRVHTIAGWNAWGIAYLFGVASLGAGIFRFAASELYDFEKYVAHGELDGLLIRPTPVLMALIARGVNLNRLGMPVQGLAVTAVAIAGAWTSRHLGVAAIFETALTVLIGAVIWFAVGLAIAGIGLYAERVDELQVATTYAPSFASYYPLAVYPGWLRNFLTYGIPVAFATYFPSRYTLGYGGSPADYLYSACVAGLALGIASLIWGLGLKHYRGTGT